MRLPKAVHRLLRWLDRKPGAFGLPPPDDKALARRAAALGADAPSIGVVVPVFETPPVLLRTCVASVLASVYPNWTLYLVDDASRSADLQAVLAEVAGRDRRVMVHHRESNGGIAAATNTGVDLATDDVLVFLDHDDELTPDALLEVAEAFAGSPDLDAAYSDQVKLDAVGTIREHFFKPDWSPVYLMGVMYVGHLLAVRSGLVRDLRFQSRFDGVQDFEFMLRLSERTDRIRHLAKPLYAWRAIPGSLALGGSEKRDIDRLQRDAVSEHLARIGRSWCAVSHPTLPHRVQIKASDRTARPSVSVIVPTRDQPEMIGRCLATVREVTRYPDLEIVVVDNGTTEPAALAALASADVTVAYEQPFNFSDACNRGVAASRGDVLVFLNNDTEITEADWLSDLVVFLEDPRVGAVGPTLLYPDGSVQHAGVVLGARGTADHVMRGFRPDWDGYAGSLAVAREVSAVTGACLVVRRADFDAVGGFSTDYHKHYQDVDLCLRLRERGFSNICASHVRLLHHESATRAEAGYDMGDRAILVDRWWELIAAGDPFYNRNLEVETLRYEPRPKALGPVSRWPWRQPKRPRL